MNLMPTLTHRSADRCSAVGRFLLLVLPGLWTGTVVALAFVVPGRFHVVQLLTVAPVIACAGSGQPRYVLLGGGCALVGLLPLTDAGAPGNLESELGHVLAILAVIGASYPITGRRVRLSRELDRVREVAVVAQGVVLRALPRRTGPLTVACDYLSASRGARIGGDLYEVLATPYGIRVVLGDVRGHGLSAVGTVAALLGCFREAAYDEPELAGVLRRLDRSLARHLREPAPAGDGAGPRTEEFATAVLLELREDGTLSVINCGHPGPYRITGGVRPRVEPLTTADPLPPLGVLDPGTGRPVVLRVRLAPGQGLLLYTDGAEEARDPAGQFFDLRHALTRAAGQAVTGGVVDPAVLVAAVRAALLAHTGPRGLTDDVALLALIRDPAPVVPPARDDPAGRTSFGAGLPG
ncbi:PP2C family protein-serine/threonine phosphatase [Streptomyces sp. SL13]|jgi:serine phosphatase RsbU (regulator of sigma subunit)|uniref:PP2C family protein-serine/threonine phosphatase n=1 Tax=Streptantibioticus silvisoli TaxID=2705255 RepID=A0AA90HC66_9ACTN|nr:PP2C family protein-serine/threonine phosphatase [Streptantibioticus silvisoli]MDI5966043.1 PP2C family protein-serine/threonine phosphatase [Streptantibioticus silvisoli]MDI5973607.1 PP2C family protein-serine/threonine phosphatase [Streptantibioticus silvisoli]